MISPRTTANRAAVCLVLLVGLAACGGDDDAADTTTAPASTTAESSGGDAVAGEEVWAIAGCGGCHTLAAAGSEGQLRGPNLDDLQPDFDTVVRQVTSGGGGMPAFSERLTEEQIQDVAAYVSENAGG
jgi:mono/diheme cytochrome c family protein